MSKSTYPYHNKTIVMMRTQEEHVELCNSIVCINSNDYHCRRHEYFKKLIIMTILTQ